MEQGINRAMADLDELLGALGTQTAPSALEAIDAGVMQGLAERRQAGAARRGMVLGIAGAAMLGLVGAFTTATPAKAEPLFGVPAEAPSHLLAD